jgi:zinc transport system substrate-binding protein
LLRASARYASAVFALLALLAAPAFPKEPFGVTVSILPQKYFVEKIGGDYVNVTVLVPPGADPHVYEPHPRQIIELSRSRLYLAIGVPFEDAWIPRFAAANPRLRIVHTEYGIWKIPMVSEHASGARSHGTVEEGLDPHVWLSPPLVKIIAGNIREALSSADPADSAAYRARYDAFVREIDSLDSYLKSLFPADAPARKFMVFHPAWGYFAQTYHLVQIPVEIEGREPKPAEILQLVKTARSEDIRVIFVQPQFSTRSAKTIAGSIGGSIVVADDLAENWDRNLRSVAVSFKDALR